MYPFRSKKDLKSNEKDLLTLQGWDFLDKKDAKDIDDKIGLEHR